MTGTYHRRFSDKQLTAVRKIQYAYSAGSTKGLCAASPYPYPDHRGKGTFLSTVYGRACMRRQRRGTVPHTRDIPGRRHPVQTGDEGWAHPEHSRGDSIHGRHSTQGTHSRRILTEMGRGEGQSCPRKHPYSPVQAHGSLITRASRPASQSGTFLSTV